MAFFGHFWAKNGVTFGDGGSETLDNLHQNLAKHGFLSPAPSERVEGPTSDHSGPTNTVLGQKLAFFGHFLG